MSFHGDLIAQARRLYKLDGRRPKQANLRRAVSSAYYAVFHYLIDQACRNAVGTQLAQQPFRNSLARGFDHGTMKDACSSFAGGTLPTSVRRALPIPFVVPREIQNISRTFGELQEQRHRADYDLSEKFFKRDVMTLVEQADVAIRQFQNSSMSVEKKYFLSCLTMWKSLSGRR